MGLLIIKNNVPKPSPETLTIPEFRALWSRDNHKHKTAAVEDISYVYHMMDWQSPYRAYSPEERGAVIIKDLIVTRPRWKEDALVKAAMVKYDEMQMTPTLRFLQSIQKAMEEMIKYFNNVNFDPEKKDDDGKKVPVSNIKNVMESVTKAAGTLKTIKELTDRVKAEQDTVENIRGGGTIGLFED